MIENFPFMLSVSKHSEIFFSNLLALLLLLELLELPILPVDLGLLSGYLPLNILVLLLPRLHLVADQGAADQTDGGTNAGPGAGIAGGAANNSAQTGAGKSSDPCAFFSGC